MDAANGSSRRDRGEVFHKPSMLQFLTFLLPSLPISSIYATSMQILPATAVLQFHQFLITPFSRLDLIKERIDLKSIQSSHNETTCSTPFFIAAPFS